MALHPIRLVTFDALHTIIVPRLPIHVQYSQVFEPYLGVIPPGRIRRSFKTGRIKPVKTDSGVSNDQPHRLQSLQVHRSRTTGLQQRITSMVD